MRTGGDGGEPGQRRRRRRGRRGRGRGQGQEHGPAHATEPSPFQGGAYQPAAFPSAAPPAEDENLAGQDFVEATAGAPQAQPAGEGGEPRRRRRRGRRGGRRNRRDHGFEPGQGEMPRAHVAAPMAETGSPEPYRSVTEPRPEPPYIPAAQPPSFEPAPAKPAPPKRRSTVREPAPIISFDEGGTPAPVAIERSHPLAPASEPNHEEEQADSNRPRRSGWWQKR
jgi:ribonuclease E